MTGDLALMTATELGDLIGRKAVSPVEAVQAVLGRIEAVDGRLHAYLTLPADEALRAAKEAEAEIAVGRRRGPLHGVPVAVKDNIATGGVRTTAGSRILADWVPAQDATIVERLRAAGAILLGKLHLSEFAYGATGMNSHYGAPVNPWGKDRIPGGSSSGSAVAVAASLSPVALGTDTGGSIRLPASLCGIVGLKPTYGRVSRFGVFPLSWSLDHAGPMTRSVADAALLLQVIAGHDPRDPSSSRAPVPDYGRALDGDIRGIRVGVLSGHFAEAIDPEVGRAVAGAVKVLRGLGASPETVELRQMGHAAAVYYPIVSSEGLAVHERWVRTRLQDYGTETRARLFLGLPILAAQYLQAQRARIPLRREVDAALQRVDVLMGATIPIAAPGLDQEAVVIDGVPEDLRSALSRFTRPFNLTGHPVISVPCGFNREGLPIGLQIAGRSFDEATVLRVAYAYEAAAGWQGRRAPV